MVSIELLVVFAQDSRTSEQCSICNSQKKPDYAFCPRCYYSLTPAEKKSLAQGSTEDYLRAYVDCWLKLKQGEQVAAERVVQEYYGKPIATPKAVPMASPHPVKVKVPSKAQLAREARQRHHQSGID